MEEIRITILSKEDCQFCVMAKSLFKQLTNEFNLNITTIEDINTPEGEEKVIKYGFLFLPGILINDVPFSYGRPSERKIRKELTKIANLK